MEDINSLLLWVFADNQVARNFYEALGGQHLKAKQAEIGGVMLNEVPTVGWI